MPFHNIVDTSRNGKTGVRREWGDWCNVDGAAFGRLPAASDEAYVDAFVWAKAGGDSDGTSDTSAVRYNSYCGKVDAFKPMPEAGVWSAAYFEMMLRSSTL